MAKTVEASGWQQWLKATAIIRLKASRLLLSLFCSWDDVLVQKISLSTTSGTLVLRTAAEPGSWDQTHRTNTVPGSWDTDELAVAVVLVSEGQEYAQHLYNGICASVSLGLTVVTQAAGDGGMQQCHRPWNDRVQCWLGPCGWREQQHALGMVGQSHDFSSSVSSRSGSSVPVPANQCYSL